MTRFEYETLKIIERIVEKDDNKLEATSKVGASIETRTRNMIFFELIQSDLKSQYTKYPLVLKQLIINGGYIESKSEGSDYSFYLSRKALEEIENYELDKAHRELEIEKNKIHFITTLIALGLTTLALIASIIFNIILIKQ
ncbi:hypothetical protein RJI07_05950 [Mycoplasmatota bacterium WC30]